MSLEENKIEVILVNEQDEQIGTLEKLKAHQNGAKLHRAFSIFVFNSKGETLLQRRASTKYHTPGKWTNTCCSHPYIGESILDAAHRRLREEMGFDCTLTEEFSFIYRAEVGNGLTEHEYDHVLFGTYNGAPKLNREEAEDYKWASLEDIKKDAKENPESYTPWLKIALERVIEYRVKNGA
ncbi:MAG: isopentenyl-diphosphate Delta-isomerase [Candidatus Micrarchaeota archaeon]|nr:isopentenyl-diphosphate Delta-isomerase [Candidatus Micrarchaeota archaeon]